MSPVIGGGAHDDAVVIHRVALRFHQALPAARRARVPIRMAGRIAIKRGEYGAGLHRHFVRGAVSPVGHLLGMIEREGESSALVSAIRTRRRVTGTQHAGQCVDIDRALDGRARAASARGHGLELPVPSRHRQPDFDFDIGVAGRFQRGLYAAKGREIFEDRTAASASATRRRRELSGGDGLRGCNRGLG